MAQGVGGTVLESPPPPGSRRERREKARPDGRSRRAPSPVAPDAEDAGSPGSRRERRQRGDDRTFWIILMPAVAALLLLTVAVGELIRSGSDTGPARPSGGGVATAAKTPETLLVAHRGADGRIDLMVMVGATHAAGSILLFPVATQVEVPSLGPTALADLPNEGDRALLQTTVENLLGVKVAKTVVVDDAGLNVALAPATPIPVELHRAVEFAGATGEPIVTAGEHRSTAGQAARLLVAKQPGSELARLVTVQDVLDAWMLRLRDRSVAAATLRAQPSLSALVAAAKLSNRHTDTLPVESVTTGGGERFEPRTADVQRYAAGAFPNALLLRVGRSRPRVEILNGTGAVGLAQTIASRVVPAGGKVTLTGNVPGFGVADTQVVYYRDSGRVGAQRMLHALGCGVLRKADTAIQVVDVTILAGADCFRTGAPPAP